MIIGILLWLPVIVFVLYAYRSNKLNNELADQQTQRDALTEGIKKDVLIRDKYTCQRCGKTADETELDVYHIIPVEIGGKTEMNNLHTLCKECHELDEK